MKNVNRDYLVTVDAKTAKITPPRDMKFFITDILTCNIFFQLVFNDSGNLINAYAPNEDASNYTLTLRILKPDNTTKEVSVTLLNEGSNFFIADLEPSCTDYLGVYQCELFIDTEINGRAERSTTDSFTYEVIKSVFTAVDEIIEGDPDYPGIMDSFATRDYVTNAIKNMDLLGFATRDYVTQVIVGGEFDLSEYVTDTELSGVLNNYVTSYVLNNALNNKADKSHTHDNYADKSHTHDNYADKTHVHDDLATITYVNNTVSNINLDGYVTDEKLSQALANLPNNGGGNIDLSNYVTEQELAEALVDFATDGTIDLSDYVTDSEFGAALSSKADRSHTHDNYATQTYVDDAIRDASFDGNVNLDGYVTDGELQTALANKADSTHSHSQYATTSQIPTSLPANGGNADTVDGCHIWFGTQTQYNAITTKDPSVIYFIEEG